MVGQAVKKLQTDLNRLPTLLARLREDGAFGPLTRGRVREFQGNNELDVDGIVGPFTQGIIDALLSALGGSNTGTASGAVRPISYDILGVSTPDNLVLQTIPPLGYIIPSTYRRNDPKNIPVFMSTPPMVARIGIFAAKKGTQERAVILALPAVGTVSRVMVYVPQNFAQASPDLDPLGWTNPLSKPFIEYMLLKHVVNRYAPQILSTRLDTALVYLGRAKGAPELGPFSKDGAFLKQVLADISSLTKGAFSYNHFETFTFSSGIIEFNQFLGGISGHFNIAKVYSLDPAGAIPAAAPPGTGLRQLVTGATMHSPVAPAGFEYMPMSRWANEFMFNLTDKSTRSKANNYLHNKCAPNFFLRLAMNT
ncbi:MAG: peptidoglycan-binding domain-containing protein [Panacagrimonas sp.]